jgi:hypothetical protein
MVRRRVSYLYSLISDFFEPIAKSRELPRHAKRQGQKTTQKVEKQTSFHSQKPTTETMPCSSSSSSSNYSGSTPAGSSSLHRSSSMSLVLLSLMNHQQVSISTFARPSDGSRDQKPIPSLPSSLLLIRSQSAGRDTNIAEILDEALALVMDDDVTLFGSQDDVVGQSAVGSRYHHPVRGQLQQHQENSSHNKIAVCPQ